MTTPSITCFVFLFAFAYVATSGQCLQFSLNIDLCKYYQFIYIYIYKVARLIGQFLFWLPCFLSSWLKHSLQEMNLQSKECPPISVDCAPESVCVVWMGDHVPKLLYGVRCSGCRPWKGTVPRRVRDAWRVSGNAFSVTVMCLRFLNGSWIFCM